MLLAAGEPFYTLGVIGSELCGRSGIHSNSCIPPALRKSASYVNMLVVNDTVGLSVMICICT